MVSGCNIGKKNAYYLAVFVVYIFVFNDFIVQSFSYAKYLDELVAVFSILLAIFLCIRGGMRVRVNKEGNFGLLILFSINALVCSIRSDLQPFFSVVLPSLLLSVKFWLAMYFGYTLFEMLDLNQYAIKIFHHVKIIVWIFVILTIADNIIGLFPAVYRYGIKSTHLFYSVPTSFAAICVFLFSIVLSVSERVRHAKRYLAIILVLLCSTLRSKAIAAAFAFALIYYFIYVRKKKITIRTFVIFIPLLVFLAWDQIEFYFFSDIQSDSARYQLLITSIKIAKDYFPFGTGLGTFGSYFSAINYSPVYSMYHISNVHGLMKGATYYTSDSFWPMILGETGVIGLVIMIILIIRLYLRIQKIRSIDTAQYTSALCILIYLLIISFAESAFVNPISIPLAIWLGQSLRLIKNNKKEISVP